jgi:hypothetical protein
MAASHRETVAEIRPETDEETMTCRDTTEACLEEEKPTSVDRKPEAAQKEEVPVENDVVKPVE